MAALLTQDPAMGFRSTTPHNHTEMKAVFFIMILGYIKPKPEE
jgi:hypothetical protein